MIKTCAYPKQLTPRSSSELVLLMLKEKKEINAKDGQCYPRTELGVFPFVYYTVIFIHSKLNPKARFRRQTFHEPNLIRIKADPQGRIQDFF